MSKKHKLVQKVDVRQQQLEKAMKIYRKSCILSRIYVIYLIDTKCLLGKKEPCRVTKDGMIYLNPRCNLTVKQWEFVQAHAVLHMILGHFDADKMPGYEIEDENGTKKIVECDPKIWNLACDIYIERFLQGIKYGDSIFNFPFIDHISTQYDEVQIYEYLKQNKIELSDYMMDMEGLKDPIYYDDGKVNGYMEEFVFEMAYQASNSIRKLSGEEQVSRWSYRIEQNENGRWFLDHYPLLGSLAANFHIIKDIEVCQKNSIQIAAVDVDKQEIYLNPLAGLEVEEWRFVLAHEFLHAGLQHHNRCQGRNHYLWNIATDFVINGWLLDMKIGKMPKNVLYAEEFKDMSAESVYDILLDDMRRFMKMDTFRGCGKGDLIGKGNGFVNGVSLDDIYKAALSQGLEYHQNHGRGYVPTGLIEEIRALSMPAIRWDVELARWFEECFKGINKVRTYTRPSRRQGSTPDIPRPGYTHNLKFDNTRTFGVIIDTSGSMTGEQIGKALGSIASYAVAKEVLLVRVVFCDASAYDAGYLTPEDIAGRVIVKGRGGTYLTPAVELLEHAKDFPDTGPILVITDGDIESNLHIHRKHAFLIPQGRKLPFKAKGEIFYFH